MRSSNDSSSTASGRGLSSTTGLISVVVGGALGGGKSEFTTDCVAGRGLDSGNATRLLRLSFTWRMTNQCY